MVNVVVVVDVVDDDVVFVDVDIDVVVDVDDDAVDDGLFMLLLLMFCCR